jgi:hypothetical protein
VIKFREKVARLPEALGLLSFTSFSREKSLFKVIAITLLTFYCFSKQASALEARAYALINLSDPSYKDANDEDISTSMRGALGIGALGAIDLIPMFFQMESGLIYNKKKFAIDPDGTTESWSMLEIPIGVRFKLNPFSVMAGFYYQMYMGTVKVADAENNFNEYEFEKKKYGTSDLGFYMGAGYNFYGFLFTDIRLGYGFKNNHIGGSSLKFVQYQIWIGVKFSLF